MHEKNLAVWKCACTLKLLCKGNTSGTSLMSYNRITKWSKQCPYYKAIAVIASYLSFYCYFLVDEEIADSDELEQQGEEHERQEEQERRPHKHLPEEPVRSKLPAQTSGGANACSRSQGMH